MRYQVVRVPEGRVLKEFNTKQEARRFRELLTAIFKKKYPFSDIAIHVRE